MANGTSITYPTLDWNWVSRVLTMAPNVWLTLRGVTMAGFRPVVRGCDSPCMLLLVPQHPPSIAAEVGKGLHYCTLLRMLLLIQQHPPCC